MISNVYSTRNISRWIACCTFLSLLVTGLCANAEEFIARIYTNSTGATLPYRLLQPTNYNSAKPYPLVLFLHGAGERGSDNSAQLKHCTKRFLAPENREQFPCFVLVPQCPQDQWWGGTNADSPIQLAMEALKSTTNEFSIDPKRIYMGGLSMGGFGTWECITRFPDRFAAAVPICGGGNENAITAAVAKVPVWAFHSADDPVVNVKGSRAMVQAMRKAGGKPNYFEYASLGHNSWDAAFAEPELFPWMFAQRLGQPDTFVLKTKAPQIPDVALFPEDSAFPGKGPIRKVEWFRNLWSELRTGWWNSREQDQGAVVFLGDSITHWWGTLAKDFPQYKVANRGISGDVTRGVLYRLKKDVLDLNPTAVVLLIGTNDLEEKGTPEEIVDNVRLLLAECKTHNPKMPVIVCKVMPSHANLKRPADKIQKVNALLEAAVKADPMVQCCDTYSIFADKDGNAKTEEFPDLLHPNAVGYGKFSEALRPILEKLNVPARK